mmetsp:Transcript_85158/g.260234  ORF Transcript_85158/g.260234 Transcript_85158/m.260234 type:complete len:260 (-) Transcript_85158:435-1214(-)
MTFRRSGRLHADSARSCDCVRARDQKRKCWAWHPKCTPLRPPHKTNWPSFPMLSRPSKSLLAYVMEPVPGTPSTYSMAEPCTCIVGRATSSGSASMSAAVCSSSTANRMSGETRTASATARASRAFAINSAIFAAADSSGELTLKRNLDARSQYVGVGLTRASSISIATSEGSVPEPMMPATASRTFANMGSRISSSLFSLSYSTHLTRTANSTSEPPRSWKTAATWCQRPGASGLGPRTAPLDLPTVVSSATAPPGDT